MNWWPLIIALLLEEEEKKKETEERTHSRYKKRFLRSLGAEGRQIRQRRIPRVSLLNQDASPWRKLYYSYNNQALITATGMSYHAFEYLVSKFTWYFDNYTPFNGRVTKKVNLGRRRKIDAIDCVGLVLVWTRTRGGVHALQMIFGMSMTNLCDYLRFGRRIVVQVLKDDVNAMVAVPSAEKIEEYKAAINQQYPVLNDVWATMDGLKLRIQQASSTDQQALFYNGWKHDHFVTAVMCFCPDGTIPLTFFNVPGAQHDSTVCELGGIYDKLEQIYEETGGICTVDSAFRSKSAPYLLKSSQQTEIGEGETEDEIRDSILVKRAATSMRQAAEWGMRALQSSFPRILDRIVYEERGERRIMMKMMVLLYNFRARLVGINQIQNVYMANLIQDANDYLN